MVPPSFVLRHSACFWTWIVSIGPKLDPTSWSLAEQERVSLLTVPFRDWETQYVSQTARHSSGSIMRCCKSEVFVHEGALGGYQ
jgi:hypothetical protein